MPDISQLLAMLQGGGQQSGIPLGGIAAPTPLSGIPFGEQGMGLSGGGGSMSGMGSGAAPMGAMGGGGLESIDPAMLQQLMSQFQGAGDGGGGGFGSAQSGALGQFGVGSVGGQDLGYSGSGPTAQRTAPTSGTGAGWGGDLKTALSLGKLGTQAYDLYSKLFPSDPTRGYVGGAEQMQGSDQSIADILRSAGGEAPTAGSPYSGALTGASGGSYTGTLGETTPFQIPSDVMSGAGCGGFAPTIGAGGGSDALTAGEMGGGSLTAGGDTAGSAGGLGFGSIAPGLGTAAGLYGLASGIQQGNPEQATGGALAAGAGGSALAGMSSLAGPLGLAAAFIPQMMHLFTKEFQGPYEGTRTAAQSLLGQSFGGFGPALQEATYGGPGALQKLLSPEGLQPYGFEVNPAGEYGISSAGHPYLPQSQAVSMQQQLTQAAQNAMAQSQMMQGWPSEVRAQMLADFKAQQAARNTAEMEAAANRRRIEQEITQSYAFGG